MLKINNVNYKNEINDNKTNKNENKKRKKKKSKLNILIKMKIKMSIKPYILDGSVKNVFSLQIISAIN